MPELKQLDDEAILIQNAYRKVLRSLPKEVTTEEKKMIRSAYEMAVEAHKLQRRKNGEPYILHPIEVARICAEEMGLGSKAIVGALLHDVVEDTHITLDEIKAKFGKTIALIVDGLTKFNQAVGDEDDDDESRSMQAENFRKILLTLAKDVRVVLIKLADRLHNMRTIEFMKQEKRLKIASETTYVYAPLAHRLGLYNIKTELEDLSLKVTDPETYNFVVGKLEETERDRNAYIRRFIAPIKAKLAETDLNFKLFGRVKSINSIANKLKAKQIPLEEIYDIFAIRAVLDIPRDKEKQGCWQVYSIITDIYVPVPERLKDWIAIPKPNGYESLHSTVMGPQGRFVEVQIRSERMDLLAEKGVAAHWRYKGGGEERGFEEWLSRAREVLESPNSDAIDVLNDFKENLLSEHVHVFTPKGDIKHYPVGATALDFAFDIHTKVGYHCKSIKINGRIMPMSYRLQNGDQIEVITNNAQKPTEDWLNMVVTSRARSKVRQALREDTRLRADYGKEVLQRKLSHMKINFEENVDTLAKYYGFENRMELLFAIALEKVNLGEIKNLKLENGRLQLPKPESTAAENKSDDLGQQLVTKREFKGKPKLMIDGDDASLLQHSLATCCNPVQGDSVFAFLTSKNDIKIHRTTCPNAEHLQATYGYRIRRAEWVDSLEASFVAEVKITGIDDLGVVRRLTDTITQLLRINMRSISMRGEAGYFEGSIGVVINNRDQLNLLIKTLKDIDGVNTVERVL